MMRFAEISSPAVWDSFVATADGGQFLQSWGWGVFQQQQGQRVWRVGVFADDELISAALLIEHRLPLSRSYLYTPHGPVFRNGLSVVQKEAAIKLLLSKVRDVSIATTTRQEIFFRLEPRLTREELGNFFFNLGLRSAAAVQPQDTSVINLRRDEQDLLAQMHHKTRYNIRLAEKHGVTVRVASQDKDMDLFWAMMESTTRRDGFRPHTRSYYQTLWRSCADTDIHNQTELTIKLLLAEKDGLPLAGALVSFYGDRAVYLHGASNEIMRHVMAPYLLQWEAIKLAKRSGYGRYDFYGVRPTQRQLSPNGREQNWGGITRFKQGFGGQEVNYVGAWDWVYATMWYRWYLLAKRFI